MSLFSLAKVDWQMLEFARTGNSEQGKKMEQKFPKWIVKNLSGLHWVIESSSNLGFARTFALLAGVHWKQMDYKNRVRLRE